MQTTNPYCVRRLIKPTHRVRRALENTASPLAQDQPDSVLTYGRGMMQVDKAWALLQRSRQVDRPDVRYEVSVQPKGASGGGSKGRGVYLRHHPGALPCCYTVTVRQQCDDMCACDTARC